MKRNSVFASTIDGMTKEERRFMRDLVKLMDSCPYSLRSAMLVDCRDNERSNVAGIIAGCCNDCAQDLVLNAAHSIMHNAVMSDENAVLQ